MGANCSFLTVNLFKILKDGDPIESVSAPLLVYLDACFESSEWQQWWVPQANSPDKFKV